jgi:hypothetical protein
VRPESSEFSARPDHNLAVALRAALDRPGDAAFAAAVLARARTAGVGWSRAAFARWTRAAMVAALIAGVIGGLVAGTTQPAPTSFEAAWVSGATGSAAAAALLTAEHAPDASILFAATAAN